MKWEQIGTLKRKQIYTVKGEQITPKTGKQIAIRKPDWCYGKITARHYERTDRHQERRTDSH